MCFEGDHVHLGHHLGRHHHRLDLRGRQELEKVKMIKS